MNKECVREAVKYWKKIADCRVLNPEGPTKGQKHINILLALAEEVLSASSDLPKKWDIDTTDKPLFGMGYNKALDEVAMHRVKSGVSVEEIQAVRDNAVDCPDCDNSGRTMPEGDICEFCYRNPDSKFNLPQAIHKLINR